MFDSAMAVMMRAMLPRTGLLPPGERWPWTSAAMARLAAEPKSLCEPLVWPAALIDCAFAFFAACSASMLFRCAFAMVRGRYQQTLPRETELPTAHP